VGCRPGEIGILDDTSGWGSRTWTAVCHGRSHRCSAFRVGNSLQANCTLEQDEEAGRAEGGGQSAASRDPAIEREVVREGTADVVVLRGRFGLATEEFELEVAPVARPSSVTLRISGALGEVPSNCEAGLMVDGQLTRLFGADRAVGETRRYEFPIDITFIRRVATATRVVGRLCDIEWRLGENEQRVIRELLARYDEEATWAGQRTSGGESAPR